MRGRLRAARGITLIELVVALAIFGLVAVLGLQALTGTLGEHGPQMARRDVPPVFQQQNVVHGRTISSGMCHLDPTNPADETASNSGINTTANISESGLPGRGPVEIHADSVVAAGSFAQ